MTSHISLFGFGFLSGGRVLFGLAGRFLLLASLLLSVVFVLFDFVFLFELVCHVLLDFLSLLRHLTPLDAGFRENHSHLESLSVLLLEFGSDGISVFRRKDHLSRLRLFGCVRVLCFLLLFLFLAALLVWLLARRLFAALLARLLGRRLLLVFLDPSFLTAFLLRLRFASGRWSLGLDCFLAVLFAGFLLRRFLDLLNALFLGLRCAALGFFHFILYLIMTIDQIWFLHFVRKICLKII